MKHAFRLALLAACLLALAVPAGAQSAAASGRATAAYAGAFGDSTTVTISLPPMSPGQPGKPMVFDGSSAPRTPPPPPPPLHAWLTDGDSFEASSIVIDQGELKASGGDLTFVVSGVAGLAESGRIVLLVARPDRVVVWGPMELLAR